MYSSQLLLQSMSCIFSAFFFSIYCVLMRPLSLIIFLVIVCSGTECVFFFFLVRFLQIELTWGVHFWYDQVRCNLQIDLLILLYYFPILSDLLNKWSCELKEGNISTLTTLITKKKKKSYSDENSSVLKALMERFGILC